MSALFANVPQKVARPKWVKGKVFFNATVYTATMYGPAGGSTLIFSYILRLGPFFGV